MSKENTQTLALCRLDFEFENVLSVSCDSLRLSKADWQHQLMRKATRCVNVSVGLFLKPAQIALVSNEPEEEGPLAFGSCLSYGFPG